MEPPSVDEVVRIAGLRDPVLRNLCITQAYFELSQAMARQTGGVANWCTFATWASKQAGQSIRGEVLRRAFEHRFGESDEIRLALVALADVLRRLGARADVQALRAAVQRILNPQTAFARAAGAVARGNRKVFEEIGREFARYLAAFQDDAAFDAAKTTAFCDALRSGEPPDGQRLLREAFTAYREACSAPDEKARAEALFFANLLVGLHEQTRLQPEIAEALNASLGDREALKRRLLAALLPGFWLRIRYQAAHLIGRKLPLDVAIDRLIDQAQSEIRRIITRALMTLHLPGGTVLWLGQDVRTPFPPLLAQIANPRLLAVLAQVDVSPDSTRASGTADWADFADRMHFITDLFRTHHAWPPLLDAPFIDEQVSVLKRGMRPNGPL